MSTIDKKIKNIKENISNYWGKRIISELEYAKRLSQINKNKYNQLIKEVLNFLLKNQKENYISQNTAKKAEEKLNELSKIAKKYKIICAGHAHIDMNWQWRYDETVAITIDTFKTVLTLMEEYSEFTFSQSQASVYKIIADYAPSMLEDIKTRIKEGRWEVTASTWVETDKNLPNGESLSRHILYTKQYLSQLLDINPESLNIDFEPDTFGHNQNVPEILSNGNIKYYYFCRGYEDSTLFRWQSPSGKSILAYREPFWYNAKIDYDIAPAVPELCQKHGMNTLLKVYGVGDHGGGPTRRDIEKIKDMARWPIYPEFKFGRLKDFYKKAEKVNNLPVVENELNFIFTGCYTSQSRIKKANKIGENTLYEAELFNSFSNLLTDYEYNKEKFAESWQNILFNQFHDIIPGSGTIDTREHALGLFQETMALANSKRSLALREITKNIDTSKLAQNNEDIKSSTSEGAGVGFEVDKFKISQTGRGEGLNRLFTIFNSVPYKRKETVELTVWDWPGDLDLIEFKDNEGKVVKHQLLEEGYNDYWGHEYLKVLIEVEIPAGGYRLYSLDEKEKYEFKTSLPKDPRLEKINDFNLENKKIKVKFDSVNGTITSFIDKKTGQELVDKPAGIFRFIKEDETGGGTAWVVGRYKEIDSIHRNVKIKKVNYKDNNLRKAISIETDFKKSHLKAIISLDKNSSRLNYRVDCDWQEIGKPGKFVPQLNFYFPVNYVCDHYKYDIPMGFITRDKMNRDVPGNSLVVGINNKGNSLMINSKGKYGFRGTDNSISLSLIRGSYDPDPYPELGKHEMEFSVCLVDNKNNNLIKKSFQYNHPLNVISTKIHEGFLPTQKTLLSMKGNIAISSIKKPEKATDEDKLIIRLYETEGISSKAGLKFPFKIKNAYFIDITEKEIELDSNIKIEDKEINFDTIPDSIINICVVFDIN
ncbi:MAG: alpha-mannosidase [Halanaerobiaceae bacterium]